ncbi:MAG: hypothetical protein WBD17_03515, partial [Candidatus Omnitrophota bacterium]
TRKGDGADLAIMELTRRTIPDEKLLGISEKKKPEKKKKAKAKGKKAEEIAKEKAEEKAVHAAPEVADEEKEERAVEAIRKEKAKTEQKKITKKGGFWRRFQRKSMG